MARLCPEENERIDWLIRPSCFNGATMTTHKPTIGILTSGGDCPGLNAVIRAVAKSAERLGYDCVGFLRGYEGLIEPVGYMPLNARNTAGILT